MGRAIDMEKDLDKLWTEVERLKTAFDGLASTVEALETTAPAKRTVDLHEEIQKNHAPSDARNKRAKGKKSKVKAVPSML
tara:strand:+ start:1359 stop:1598 length:240 start_codon:yes stop_codon:yes gene_type:complete